MSVSYTQPYFGADVSWLRLVALPEANELVLSHPKVQWNTTGVNTICALLPRNGALITRIDREFRELADMPGIDIWSTHNRVHSVVIHGAYNHGVSRDREHCKNPTVIPDVTKTHKVQFSHVGTTVHLLSEDFFRSFCSSNFRSPPVSNFAFNRALVDLTGLRLPNEYTSHQKQFTYGVTAPFYDLVCAHHDPNLGFTCSAYLTHYVAPTAPLFY